MSIANVHFESITSYGLVGLYIKVLISHLIFYIMIYPRLTFESARCFLLQYYCPFRVFFFCVFCVENWRGEDVVVICEVAGVVPAA